MEFPVVQSIGDSLATVSGSQDRTAAKDGTRAISTTSIWAWLRRSKGELCDCQRTPPLPSLLKRRLRASRLQASSDTSWIARLSELHASISESTTGAQSTCTN